VAFADQLAAVLVHAQAAGNAITPAITDVNVAYPVAPGRCGRIFYGGEAEGERIGARRTLNSELIGEQITIVFFWPLSEIGETASASTETELYNLKHQLRTRLLGDSQLGGQSADLVLEYIEPGFWETTGGGAWRTLEASVLCEFTEYPIGA
jgi:hypothetical protein